MDELKIIDTIKNTLSDASYIGDDCAYLSELGICVTQDSLVEGVHFSMDYTTPFHLGLKSVKVNLSDLLAGLSIPRYISISLSIPKYVRDDFAEEFFKGVNQACKIYGVKVIGGDITSASKVFISICAIGKKDCETNVSRNNAKAGDVVVIAGISGASALGLELLRKNNNLINKYTKIHIEPEIQYEASISLQKLNLKRICIMDTSDGLADAIYKTATASRTSMIIEGNKIPTEEDFFETANDPYEKILYGGEDYALFLTLAAEDYRKLNEELFTRIGTVTGMKIPTTVTFDDNRIFTIDKNKILNNSFNHFKHKGE